VAIPALIKSRAAAVLGVVLAFLLIALLLRTGQGRSLTDHLYPVPGGDDRPVVEVLNATGQQGLARVGTRALRRGGLDVVFFGNADTTTDSTRLIVRRGSRDLGVDVRKILGTGKIEIALDSTRRVDVTVLLGADWKAPEELHP
jgi:hypothetical protein